MKPGNEAGASDSKELPMKKIHMVPVFAFLTAMSGVALAHPGGGRMFERLDTNNDGKVTLAEAQAGAQARFNALDKNKDGVITQDELGDGHFMMKHADANGDGKVTLAELQAQTQAWFSKLDANHDNVITKDELKAAHEAHGDKPCDKKS
jgi:Ca2+-binding EF-hand superfamily protein